MRINHILVSFFAFVFLGLNAQNMNDVFHYNRSELNGTARYLGTVGTISAIGADLSAVAANPAGATAFVSNRISWSPGFFGRNNSTVYNNQSEFYSVKSFYYRPFFTNQWGMVFPFVSKKNKWNKIVFGITGNKEYDYHNGIRMKGESGAMQSVADYFVAQAEGVPTGDLNIYEGESMESVYDWLGSSYGSYAQHAFLAYQAYVIDPLSFDSLNTVYVSNALYSSPLYHKLTQETQGKKYSTDIFFAAQMDKKLSLGVSMTLKTLNYSRENDFAESGYDTHSILQSVNYYNKLMTEAEGFQMKFGMMYQIDKNLKISLAYHTPVWWEIEESTQEGIKTTALDVDDLDGDGNTAEVNTFEFFPGTLNVYESYKYISPGSWQIGLSYVVGKIGFLALNYGQKNWSMTRFSSINGDPESNKYYEYLNDEINQTFTVSHHFNIGGELKLQEWSVRAGYFMKTSPFKQTAAAKTTGYGFGIGYDFGNFELDYGIRYSNQSYTEQLFPVGLTQKYDINTVSNTHSLTLRFNF